MNLESLIIDVEKRANLIYDDIYFLIETSGYKECEKKLLVFSIADKNDINGRAWCLKDKDYIEINKGVIKQHYDYFFSVNEYYKNNVLELIMPEESKEKFERMSVEGLYYKKGIPVTYDSKVIIEERASLLDIFVSRFILLHEMGHIFNGHCILLASEEKDFKYIPMYYSNSIIEKNVCALDVRTLEMDADSFAVTQSMRHIMYLYTNFNEQVLCQGLEPEDLFFWWAFAIRSHFLICEDYLMDSDKYEDKMKHLPSYARSIMFANTALQLIGMLNLSIDEINRIKKRFAQGVIEAEKVFNNLKYTNYNSILTRVENNKDFIYYSREVNENWINLVKKLKSYSRCPLYEPEGNSFL